MMSVWRAFVVLGLLLALLASCGSNVLDVAHSSVPDPAAAIVDVCGGPEIGAFIERFAKEEDAEENVDARKIVCGDLDGDGKSETAVLFTLESFNGSNLWRQYISVFAGTASKLDLIDTKTVGGKNYSLVKDVKVENESIELTSLDYRPEDASCCPSLPGREVLLLAQGHLRVRER